MLTLEKIKECGKILDEIRKETGLSVEEFSKKVGEYIDNNPNASHYELGKFVYDLKAK